uniref:Uncharacterized protein n=1 Tax=Solanum tuberosum TaxID=4113 RepID=M1DMH1_SOLTU
MVLGTTTGPHEPWSRPRAVVLPVVLGQWLGQSVLASLILRHLHEPSHEPWSRPLVVKWLVEVCHFEATLRELLPCLHKSHHGPCSSPLAVVVVVDLRQCAQAWGSLGLWLGPCPFILALAF